MHTQTQPSGFVGEGGDDGGLVGLGWWKVGVYGKEGRLVGMGKRKSVLVKGFFLCVFLILFFICSIHSILVCISYRCESSTPSLIRRKRKIFF